MLAEEVETTNKIDNLKQTEPEVHNETTKVSQNWLKQAKDKVLRWSGHGILTAVSEGFVRVGGAFTYIGAEFLRRKGEFMSIAKTAPDFTNAISALPADQVPLVYQALDQAFKTIPLVGVTAGLIGGRNRVAGSKTLKLNFREVRVLGKQGSITGSLCFCSCFGAFNKCLITDFNPFWYEA